MPSNKEDVPSSGETPMERLIQSPKGSGRRLRGAVAHYLGTAIVSGQIAPGEILTGEIENAEALDVSRSAYREAVQVLTAKGLAESRPKVGARVLPRDRWNILDPAALAWAFSGEPDLDCARGLPRNRDLIRKIVEHGLQPV